MNIKLDENLPESLVSELQALGHDVDTVRSEHLAERDGIVVLSSGEVMRPTRRNRTQTLSACLCGG